MFAGTVPNFQARVDYIYEQAEMLLKTNTTNLALPPTNLHPRGMGMSLGLWVNVTSIQNQGYWAEIWHASFKAAEAPGRFVNVSIGFNLNYTMKLVIDQCTFNTAAQPLLQAYQWNFLAVTMSETGFLRIFWNGVQIPGAAVCGTAMAIDKTGTTMAMARFGAAELTCYQEPSC